MGLRLGMKPEDLEPRGETDAGTPSSAPTWRRSEHATPQREATARAHVESPRRPAAEPGDLPDRQGTDHDDPREGQGAAPPGRPDGDARQARRPVRAPARRRDDPQRRGGEEALQRGGAVERVAPGRLHPHPEARAAARDNAQKASSSSSTARSRWRRRRPEEGRGEGQGPEDREGPEGEAREGRRQGQGPAAVKAAPQKRGHGKAPRAAHNSRSRRGADASRFRFSGGGPGRSPPAFFISSPATAHCGGRSRNARARRGSRP